jgi:molybdenum cofactor synthesis domain-containing protein
MTPPPGMIDRCWIVTVGDELINGVRVDTNTAWLAGRLETLGIEVTRAVSVGDQAAAIQEVVAQARAAAPLVIVAGGLGPTTDDRTKGALAALFGVALERVGEIEAAVRAFFAARGRSVTPVNLDQALVPAGFGWHINPRGTAPACSTKKGGASSSYCRGCPGNSRRSTGNGWNRCCGSGRPASWCGGAGSTPPASGRATSTTGSAAWRISPRPSPWPGSPHRSESPST